MAAGVFVKGSARFNCHRRICGPSNGLSRCRRLFSQNRLLAVSRHGLKPFRRRFGWRWWRRLIRSLDTRLEIAIDFVERLNELFEKFFVEAMLFGCECRTLNASFGGGVYQSLQIDRCQLGVGRIVFCFSAVAMCLLLPLQSNRKWEWGRIDYLNRKFDALKTMKAENVKTMNANQKRRQPTLLPQLSKISRWKESSSVDR